MRTVKTEVITIADIPVFLSWKTGVRAMRVKIMPPDGRVLATSPYLTPRSEVVGFLKERYDWIVEARKKVISRPKPSSHKYIDGESVFLFGQLYPLHVETIEKGRASLLFDGKIITLKVKSDSTILQRKNLIHKFYKERLSVAVGVFMNDYRKKLNCPDIPFRILRRKSVWGTYNARTHSIVYNIDLAQVDLLYVQYVVLHEMTHQYVLAHNSEFYSRVATYMPDWQKRRKALRKFAQENIER